MFSSVHSASTLDSPDSPSDGRSSLDERDARFQPISLSSQAKRRLEVLNQVLSAEPQKPQPREVPAAKVATLE